MILEYMLATFSEWKDGWLRIAGDALGAKKGTGRAMPVVMPLGIISRPRDPDTDTDGNPTIGAGLLTFKQGGDMWCMPTTDPRAVAKVPPALPGGFAIYAFPGTCLNFDGENGSAMMIVPSTHDTDDQTGKKNHGFSIDNPGDAIALIHALGMSIRMVGGGKNSVTIANRSEPGKCAYIEVNDDGNVMNGNSKCNGSLTVGVVNAAMNVALADAFIQYITAIDTLLKVTFAAPTVFPGTLSAAYATAYETAGIQALLEALSTVGTSKKLKASP